jgi:surface polysaccharide O-acyltransferase-like enzyme
LGIYVLHPVVLAYMRYRFSDESAEGGFLFTMTVGPLAAFIVTYLFASLIINIPLLRRTIT